MSNPRLGAGSQLIELGDCGVVELRVAMLPIGGIAVVNFPLRYLRRILYVKCTCLTIFGTVASVLD